MFWAPNFSIKIKTSNTSQYGFHACPIHSCGEEINLHTHKTDRQTMKLKYIHQLKLISDCDPWEDHIGIVDHWLQNNMLYDKKSSSVLWVDILHGCCQGSCTFE